MNGVLMQYFHWYINHNEHLWNKVKNDAKHLKEIGISALWLPPAYKGAGGINDTGYGVYDMYDLGEFDQKGSIETKYGTKDEYLDCIRELHKYNLDVYADLVLNHRIGADEFELVEAREVNRLNTEQIISDDELIKVATRFTFPGRNNKYSSFKWSWKNFDGIDYDEKTHRNSIFLFDDKSWDDEVDDERGNFDYLMGADLDFNNEDTLKEVYSWAKWYIQLTDLDGFRLDAIKHISASFYEYFLTEMRNTFHKELFSVGEYWHGDVKHLINYLKEVNFNMSLFDVPLHYHFYDASLNENYDMRNLFKGTLTEAYPNNSVTFVDNHDSEPTQSLSSFISNWFKPLAYALILLRIEGYPCVFYGDYYGIEYEHVPSFQKILDQLLYLRKNYAYGSQNDYFDHSHVVGFVRRNEEKHEPMIVIMSNSQGGIKQMHAGSEFAGLQFYDYLGNVNEIITIDNNGNGLFKTNDKSLSVYIKRV